MAIHRSGRSGRTAVCEAQVPRWWRSRSLGCGGAGRHARFRRGCYISPAAVNPPILLGRLADRVPPAASIPLGDARYSPHFPASCADRGPIGSHDLAQRSIRRRAKQKTVGSSAGQRKQRNAFVTRGRTPEKIPPSTLAAGILIAQQRQNPPPLQYLFHLAASCLPSAGYTVRSSRGTR